MWLINELSLVTLTRDEALEQHPIHSFSISGRFLGGFMI